MFLGKKHHSYSASLHPGVKMSDSRPIRGVKAEGGGGGKKYSLLSPPDTETEMNSYAGFFLIA